RLARGWYASDSRFQGDVKLRAEAALASCATADCMKTMGGRYIETTWKRRTGPQDVGAGVVDESEWRDLLGRWAGGLGGTALGPLEEPADAFSVGTVLARTAGSLTVASVVWDKRSFDSWWESGRPTLDAKLDVPVERYTLASPASGGCTVDTWAEIP